MGSRNIDRRFAQLEYVMLRGAMFLIFVVGLIRFLIHEFRQFLPP